MKFLAFALSLVFMNSVSAATLISKKEKVSVARVVKVMNLVSKPGLLVSVAVQDLGGSTDVAPTQTAYLTLYSKGEMFSTEATFNLGSFLEVKSARRLAAGVYEVTATDASTLKDVKLMLDAKNATYAIQRVACEDFDCEASRDFSTTIEMTVK